MSKSSKPKKKRSAADTFYEDLKDFKEKYPMVYVECWTPDDFTVSEEDEFGEIIEHTDWEDVRHVITVDRLYHSFDANLGTNWTRISYCRYSVSQEEEY